MFNLIPNLKQMGVKNNKTRRKNKIEINKLTFQMYLISAHRRILNQECKFDPMCLKKVQFFSLLKQNADEAFFNFNLD